MDGSEEEKWPRYLTKPWFHVVSSSKVLTDAPLLVRAFASISDNSLKQMKISKNDKG